MLGAILALESHATESTVICQVYRSSKKADTYLYLPRPQGEAQDNSTSDMKNINPQSADAFAVVPDTLLNMLGKLEWVMDVDLTTRDQLAQVDCATLIEQLNKTGYFLQLPPAHYRGV